MPPVTALAVDLGSSSGRIVAGTFDGATITDVLIERAAAAGIGRAIP